MNETIEQAQIRKPVCRLTGEDGNAFAIIGRVSRALKNDGQIARAKEFTERAFQQKSYDDLLAFCCDYVDAR